MARTNLIKNGEIRSYIPLYPLVVKKYQYLYIYDLTDSSNSDAICVGRMIGEIKYPVSRFLHFEDSQLNLVQNKLKRFHPSRRINQTLSLQVRPTS